MRILCIADEYPWPATNGLRMRVANVLAGLAAAGDVDFFCTVSERPDLDGVSAAPEGVARTLVHHRPPYRSSFAELPGWLVRSRLPRAVAWRDWDGARAALHAWAKPPYDVVWYCQGHAWLGLGDRSLGPAVIDFNDLEDHKAHSLLRLGRRFDLGAQASSSVRRALAHRLAGIDAARWSRAYRQMNTEAARVVVCSELDRSRLDDNTRAVVVPNGFEEPAVVTSPTAEPNLLMVGLQTYEPNIDGAHFFAKDVLPLVRRRVPAATFVIVGRQRGALDDLAGLDGVVVHGEVDDLGPVFAAARAVVVPLRIGSGTRVKVLEAFAHRLPVVSTTIGCEGLDIVDGTHALVADEPAALADACVRVLTDDELAAAIAGNGHALWHAKYRWPDIHARITALAREVAGS